MKYLLPLCLALLIVLLITLRAATADDGCDLIRSNMPDAFTAFEEASCETWGGQTRARLELTVPAGQVEETADLLTSQYGMGRMVFVCCGHEPEQGQSGWIDLPSDAQTPPGAFTSLGMALVSPGFTVEPDESLPEFPPLGAVDATLILSLVDV